MADKLAAVNAVWAEVEKRNINAVRKWTGMEHHVSQVNRFHDRLRRSPDLAAYREDAGDSQKQAMAEVGFSEKTGLFLSAYDFVGGRGPQQYAIRCEKRLATWIYGSRSTNPHMEATFRVEPFPPSSDYELIISGQDDDAEAKCRIRIWVKESKIFEGENPFARFGWSRHTFRIPAASLKRQNRLRIENAEDTSRGGGSSFLMLNYAVVTQDQYGNVHAAGYHIAGWFDIFQQGNIDGDVGLYSATGASYQLLRLIERGHVTPVLSTALVFEYEEVLKRNHKLLKLSNRAIDDVLNGLCNRGECQRIHFLWRPQLSDPKDDHILELAVAAGNADIVTHNAGDAYVHLREWNLNLRFVQRQLDGSRSSLLDGREFVRLGPHSDQGGGKQFDFIHLAGCSVQSNHVPDLKGAQHQQHDARCVPLSTWPCTVCAWFW